MKLSAASIQRIEKFFRRVSNDHDFVLPPIYFYAGFWTNVLTKILGVNGITVGSRIFILPKLIEKSSCGVPKLGRNLCVHEIVHVVQYQQRGFWRFLAEYFGEYLKNLRRLKRFDRAARNQAYLEISFEIEARRLAEEFEFVERNSEQ